MAPPRYTYDQAPLLVYWEVTRACDLACQHCRAEALARRDPDELTTPEAETLLHDLAAFGSPPPRLVITGGDPMWRPDLFHLIALARCLGLPVALAPSATPRITPAVLARFHELGVEAISFSLDGATADLHDGIRGVPGTYQRTLNLIQAAAAAGLPVQVNTLVCSRTAPNLPAIYEALLRLPIVRWSVFFLVAVGRGALLDPVAPEEAEALCHWLADRAAEAPFAIKTTEAPHFRRVAIERLQARGMRVPDILRLPLARGFGVRDGNGIVFISHTGDVYPSGFLPVAAGNVRERPITAIYRHAALFQDLRDPDRYEGKCGICPYRYLCGGSRARAWAATGNPLGSDPLCPYQPPAGARTVG